MLSETSSLCSLSMAYWRGNSLKTTDKFTPLSGTVIKTEKGYYYVKNGQRRPITSRAVLNSWRFYKIAKTTEEAVNHLPVTAKLGFRDGSLLWCIADGKYYLVSNGQLHHVQDPDEIKRHGMRFTDAIIVSASQRDLHVRAK